MGEPHRVGQRAGQGRAGKVTHLEVEWIVIGFLWQTLKEFTSILDYRQILPPESTRCLLVPTKQITFKVTNKILPSEITSL